MRLRDPRDGRELLLVRSRISTPMTTGGGVTVTRLESALGDYALLTTDGGRGLAGPHLRVDCISGRAVGWVTPGA